MDFDAAMLFVREHGVVLSTARGPVPRMAEVIVGELITSWPHPKGGHMFTMLKLLEQSPNILVCRIVGGKITLVHRRLWPALISAAAKFPPGNLARVQGDHTVVPYPEWVDQETLMQARLLSERDALQALGAWTLPLRD